MVEKELMSAAVFEDEGKLALKEIPIPRITKPDHVLLKVEAASICGTDIKILQVPPLHPAEKGIVLGHEYVGTVVDKGEACQHLKVGDLAAVDPNITCGYCFFCRNGQPNMCLNMTTLGIFKDGGFAEYSVAPAKALHKVKKDIPPELAVYAEPLSCIVNAFDKLDFKIGSKVLVLGAGPIGLYFIMFFVKSFSSLVAVSEPNNYRRNYAEKLGANLVIDPNEGDLFKISEEHTKVGFDIVVDAVGTLLPQALKLVRKGGTILMFGMNDQEQSTIAPYYLTRYEIKLLGTFISNFSFARAISLIESRRLPLDKVITHRIPLSSISDGIKWMESGEALKIIVKP